MKDPRYHLFGPTVTTAMKMESHGIPSKVHVSKAVVDRLANGHNQYTMESRGNLANVPGQNETFIILSKDRAGKKHLNIRTDQKNKEKNASIKDEAKSIDSTLRKRK